MKDIAIIGAGGMGKEIVWLIENINNNLPTWNIIGFTEDERHFNNWGGDINGYPVLGGDSWLQDYKKQIYVICSLGSSPSRKLVYEKVSKYPNVILATLIDPSVRIDKSVSVGEGSIICRNCSITVDTQIGKGVLLNIGSVIGHDARIGDFCTFLPNSMAAGDTTFGDCCEVGSGAFILQGRKIVNHTIIAPLSAVFKDITVSGMYSGNPARQMR